MYFRLVNEHELSITSVKRGYETHDKSKDLKTALRYYPSLKVLALYSLQLTDSSTACLSSLMLKHLKSLFIGIYKYK